MTTTSITNTNKIFETGTTSLPEGPIRTISPKILASIPIFTDESEVSRIRNDFAFSAEKSKKQALEKTIALITEKLDQNTHTQCIADLAELQDVYESRFSEAASFIEIQQLFLAVKGVGIGILRKLPEEERDELQVAIDDQLPGSMKDLFEIADLDLESVGNVDLDTFFILLQSCQPLSIDNREEAVFRATSLGNSEFVELLLADGPISEEERGLIVCKAVKNNNPEIVKLLLAHGPITDDYREVALKRAAGDIELVNLLQ
jgi:hypothetical protein